MSIPDHELEEPDPRLCEEHSRVIPCRICKLDTYEYQQETRRENRSDLKAL